MANAWIEHCKAYAKRHNISYSEALKKAKPSYKRKKIKKGGNVAHSADYSVGEGMDDLKRRAGKLPPKSRALLQQIGNEPVRSVYIFRKPIDQEPYFNFLTFNGYKQALKKLGYDKMYHTGLVLNDKYLFHKQEVVSISILTPKYKKTFQDIVILNVPPDLTIQEFVDNTRNYMGNFNFSVYTADVHNCQEFAFAALQANKINYSSVKNWKQDTKTLFSLLPDYASWLSQWMTDLGAVWDRLIEGEGRSLKRKMKRGAGSAWWTDYVPSIASEIVGDSSLANENKQALSDVKGAVSDYMNNVGTPEEIKAKGRSAFVSAVKTGTKDVLQYNGMLNPATSYIADKLIPIMAGRQYDALMEHIAQADEPSQFFSNLLDQFIKPVNPLSYSFWLGDDWAPEGKEFAMSILQDVLQRI